MTAKLIPFRVREGRLPHDEAWLTAEKALDAPAAERKNNPLQHRFQDPEVLLCACEIMRRRLEANPSKVREDAESLYGLLCKPELEIGLFDEKEYFLGELALIAGTASRLLFYRDEASRWFDRAESKFVLTANNAAHIARLAYQRLALRLEQRQFEDVLELAPHWFQVFTRLEMPEEAIKCRFLEGVVLRETGRVSEAVAVFQDICRAAESVGNVALVAQSENNLARYYRLLGNLKEALEHAKKALPLLQQLNSRVGVAKLRWCVGDIFREQGKLGDAVDAYRAGLREAEEIGIRGDVAAIHLVLADVLLDAGFDRQAEWEIRAALPIIEEEKMVPEGYAALALLQESLRRRKIDRQALRNLHGYFQDEKS
jgi:tetratricopeptide (TPR) repeat protein